MLVPGDRCLVRNMRAETRARHTGGTHSGLGIIVIVISQLLGETPGAQDGGGSGLRLHGELVTGLNSGSSIQPASGAAGGAGDRAESYCL